MNSAKFKYKNDQEILIALKSGQMDAFDQLYSMYRDDFLKVASYKFSLVPKEDILDSWQDTIISFYEQIRSGKLVQLTCTVRNFLFLLGFRYIIKYKRHFFQEFISDHESDNNLQVTQIELDWDKPWSDEIPILHELLKMLPEQSRRILVLRYLEEKSIDEIKIELNYYSSNAVSVSLTRSLNKLRDLFLNKIQKGA